MILSLPTFTVLGAIGRQGRKVIECGAGSGLWLRIMEEYGLDAIGIDPIPRHSSVMLGSHRDLGQYSDRLLLAVWPPDGTDLKDWIKAHGGDWFAFCGSPGRVTLPTFEKGTGYYEDLSYGVGRTVCFSMGQLAAS